jgi:hypothetical protein
LFQPILVHFIFVATIDLGVDNNPGFLSWETVRYNVYLKSPSMFWGGICLMAGMATADRVMVEFNRDWKRGTSTTAWTHEPTTVVEQHAPLKMSS